VTELGKIGSERVTLKTDATKGLRREIVVMPVSQIPGAMGCSVAAMALADLSISVWPIEGGHEQRQPKGPAGPSLTAARQAMNQQVAGCGSAIGFFYGDESVAWELTYTLGATMLDADEQRILEAIVLLGEPPTPGAPVRVGNPEAPYRFVPFNR